MGVARWAVLWAALVLLPCMPVLAQNEDGRDGNVTVVDCSQVQNLFLQGQYGNANATAQYDGEAIAIVAQELDISQDQANRCLVNVGGDGGADEGGDEDSGDESDEAEGESEESGEDGDVASEEDVIPSTIVEGDLPDTGGPPLVAGLALVAALLAAGLLRR